MRRIVLFSSFFIFIVSCNVERRLHNPGWNVQWNKKFHSRTFVADYEHSVGQSKKAIFKHHPILDEEETLDNDSLEVACDSIIDLRVEDHEQFISGSFKVEKSIKTFNDSLVDVNLLWPNEFPYKKHTLEAKNLLNGDPLFLLLFILCGVLFVGLLLFALNVYTGFQVWTGLLIIGLLAYILALLILSILLKRLILVIVARLNR